MTASTEIKKCHAQVEALLKEQPSTRDSDVDLFISYLRKHTDLGGKLFFSLSDLCQVLKQDGVATPDSLTRARRKLQQHNPMLWGSKRVRDARKQESEQVSDWARNN